MDSVIETSAARFDKDVVSSEKLVLLDLWAPWCTPSKAMSPIISEYAKQQKTQLRVVKVNVEDHPSIADRYNVPGLPTVLLLKRGEVLARQVGAVTPEKLADFVASHLAA
jgi:thioredoxin